MTFNLYDQIAVLTGGGPGGRTGTLSYYITRTFAGLVTSLI
jgi:ABC-type sugar transport system permease subunit